MIKPNGPSRLQGASGEIRGWESKSRLTTAVMAFPRGGQRKFFSCNLLRDLLGAIRCSTQIAREQLEGIRRQQVRINGILAKLRAACCPSAPQGATLGHFRTAPGEVVMQPALKSDCLSVPKHLRDRTDVGARGCALHARGCTRAWVSSCAPPRVRTCLRVRGCTHACVRVCACARMRARACVWSTVARADTGFRGQSGGCRLPCDLAPDLVSVEISELEKDEEKANDRTQPFTS